MILPPLVYFIERHPTHVAKLRPFFEAAEGGEFRFVTSLITLVEVLVHPLRAGRDDLVRESRDILSRSTRLMAVPLGEAIAEEAARLRAVYNLSVPDAIQMATTRTAGAP